MMNMTTQTALYKKMMGYTLTDELVHGCDYVKLDTINGIEYFTPNDEDWGAIVAVSREQELAIDTGFFDMIDMEDEDSDYAQVVKDGKLMCRFEA